MSALGGIAGTAIASVLVFPFSAYIGIKLSLPYLRPGAGVISALLACGLILSFAAGPITALYSAIKISRAEIFVTIREGE